MGNSIAKKPSIRGKTFYRSYFKSKTPRHNWWSSLFFLRFHGKGLHGELTKICHRQASRVRYTGSLPICHRQAARARGSHRRPSEPISRAHEWGSSDLIGRIGEPLAFGDAGSKGSTTTDGSRMLFSIGQSIDESRNFSFAAGHILQLGCLICVMGCYDRVK